MLTLLKVTTKHPELQPGASLDTLTDVLKNISFAATRLFPPMRFDAENCLGGFWVQSSAFTHTTTEPLESCALAIDASADYLFILRKRQLIKVGTGAGEHVTFEGHVYLSAEVAVHGRMACLQNKLFLYEPVASADPATAVLHVYDAQSLLALPDVTVTLPPGKVIRPVDIVTDGTYLYLVLLSADDSQPAGIIVHVVSPTDCTFPLRPFASAVFFVSSQGRTQCR